MWFQTVVARPIPQDVPDKDKWPKAPTMIAALKADLSAQLSQSIASDLEAIRKHNDQIRTDHDLRRTLAEIGVRLPDHRLVTPRVLRDFERQQGRGLAEPLMDELMRRLSTMILPESGRRSSRREALHRDPDGGRDDDRAWPRLARRARPTMASRGSVEGDGLAGPDSALLDIYSPRRPLRPAGLPRRSLHCGAAGQVGEPAGG